MPRTGTGAKKRAIREQDAGTRVFDAMPPTPGRRGAFATTWWGEAWVTALEQTSLDSGRLSRGRTYARRGAVGRITVTAGRIAAKVHGSQPRPYSSSVRVRTLTDAEWDRLLDTIASRASHIAALLDRDMPEDLARDARDAGVNLLPGDRDLEPSCSCPDWGYPCKHAAALCYQIALILDADPFVLLLMRGRDEPAIMAELHRRNAIRAAAEAAQPPTSADPSGSSSPRTHTTPGTSAREAFADWQPRELADLLPMPVNTPGAPPVMDTATPVAGFDPQALEMLAADAAARATVLLRDYLNLTPDDLGATPQPLLPALDERRDAVRLLASGHADVHVFARIVDALGVDPLDLARTVKAWRLGGPVGLEVLDTPWTAPPADLARARTLLAADWDESDGSAPPRPRIWRNRWTFDDLGLQLRYGPDGRWYPYRTRDGAWWPDGTPGHDPADLLTAQ